MNMLSLVKRYLTASLPTTLLQVFTFGAGIAILLIVLNISTQLTNNFSHGKNKIDAIIGAKGSPLQLVLSGIYHADIPTGNITYTQAMRLSRHRSVKTAVPISLGDNYKGHHIVGTTKDFLQFHQAQLAGGSLWKQPMEAVIGHYVAKGQHLKVGDHFAGSHGLAVGGSEHEHMPYKIVGILEKNGTVVDRLVLTSLESVWKVHGHEEHADEKHEKEKHGNHDDHPDHHEDHDHEENTAKHDEEHEVTALLIQYKNRAAAINFPRMVNKQTSMQAASPAFEMARLFKMLAVGFDTAKIISYVLLTISVVSIFLILLSNIRKRHYDMAILRIFGAAPSKIMQLVIVEAMILTLLGVIVGFIASRITLFLIDNNAAEGTGLSLAPMSITTAELNVVGIIFAVSFLASMIPAIMAYRVNVTNLLLKRT